MLTWKDVLAQQERNRDLLHEAEQERLIRQALEGAERSERFYGVWRYARYALAALREFRVALRVRLSATTKLNEAALDIHKAR